MREYVQFAYHWLRWRVRWAFAFRRRRRMKVRQVLLDRMKRKQERVIQCLGQTESEQWEKYGALRKEWRVSEEDQAILSLGGELDSLVFPYLWGVEVRHWNRRTMLRCFDQDGKFVAGGYV